MMSIAFKEWALICEALGSGRQSIILRKGGIAEGRSGFRFEHDTFFLFPTLFHEQVSKLKLPADTPLPARGGDGQIQIHYGAHIEWTHDVRDLEIARQLAPFHLWHDSVVEERFRYDDSPGISLAFVRAFRLPQPLVFPDSPRFGGCRSWLSLPDALGQPSGFDVLDDAIHRKREMELKALLKKESPSAAPCNTLGLFPQL